jgi:hypothetical protein
MALLTHTDMPGRLASLCFRSSFRDWAGNVSNFPREITETALAHVIGDKAEQADRRSDALEKRRKLMMRGPRIVSPRLRQTWCRCASRTARRET